jgi:hypothetical protein
MTKDASGWVEEMLGGIELGPWKEGQAAAPGLGYSTVLGRRVRVGDWQDQKISTYEKIREALASNRLEEAAAFIDFFVDEADVIFNIFRQFIPDLNEFLLRRGVSKVEITEVNARLLGLLTLPDGRPFISRRLWDEFRSKARTLVLACGRGDGEQALKLLDDFKETWRQIQDRDIDHAYGLINEVVVRYGESALAELWDYIIGPLFKMRYEKFDNTKFPWAESLQTNLYLSFEAMRGHLVGPGRFGNMEFEEDKDRYTLRFDPCGSGGRALRGDTEVEHTPPRTEPPFNFGVTKEKHDFAWNKKGVCYYCSNCCVVLQLKPIDAFGYPVRVVEPPTYPSNTAAKCTWHIYKDPANVPARYYEDVGRRKPANLKPSTDGGQDGGSGAA